MQSKMVRKVLEIAANSGVLRPRDLDAHGIPRKYLNLLYHRGLLDRAGRGLYASPKAELAANAGLVQAAKWVPHGVVCLLSALQFHDIGEGQDCPGKRIKLPVRLGNARLRLQIDVGFGDAITPEPTEFHVGDDGGVVG